jgi:hypothetical protein
MFIYLGKYTNWVGSYQIANSLKNVGLSEANCDKFGDWLSETWVHKFLEWIHSKKKRIEIVKIHDYDMWNLDHSLALVILPLLKKFRSSERWGHPPTIENMEEWNKILDKMIWSFKQLVDDDNDCQFHSGVIDFVFVPNPETGRSRMEHGPNHTGKYDFEGHMAHREKIQEGLNLFSQQFMYLWD